MDFSVSGGNTAVLYDLRDQSAEEVKIADIAASFQEAVIDILVAKTLLACRTKEVDKVVVGGGVAANCRLRKRLISDAAELNIKVYYPSGQFCTDNAAMVAALGYRHYKRYKKRELSDLSLTAVPNLRFGEREYILGKDPSASSASGSNSDR